jgi:xanthine/CO dehydrogenase XdhC/CoxF family maturation factor
MYIGIIGCTAKTAMKEIQDILALWRQSRPEGRDLALATVVRVEGSSYRRPGARLLISGDGQTVGAISGGCLERDVVLKAAVVRESGKPILKRYESVSEEEAGPAASLGCGGTIEVLIEPLTERHGHGALAALEWLFSRRKCGVIATVIARHNAPVEIGQRAAIDEDGETHLTSQSSVLSPQSFQDSSQSHTLRHDLPNGWIDLFVEVIEPSLQLFIFGGGSDALPLATLGRSLGWHVTVIDLRSGPTVIGRVFDADVVVRSTAAELAKMAVPAGAAAVVMNHNWNHDLAALRRLMSVNLKYLGVLGPRHRTERMLAKLGDAEPVSAAFCYPIGLDIGAETPPEVALAIVAEITAVLRGASGGPLREKAGPIHAAPMDHTCPVAAS